MTTEPKSMSSSSADRASVSCATAAAAGGAPTDQARDHRTGADRLRAIADRLRVPVESFFVGTVGAAVDVAPVLELLDHPEKVRLVRAFAAISDPGVRQRVLSVVEAAAAGEREPGEAPSGLGTDNQGSPEGQG